MKNFAKLTSPLISLLIGILLIVFKGDIISIALTVLGALFIVLGIIDLTNNQNQVGIVRIVVGVVIIAFGWFLVSVALYVIAVLLVIAGAGAVFNLTSKKAKFSIAYLQPILFILAGLCLFFSQGTTVSWVFIVVGAILAVQGVMGLYTSLKK